MGTIRLAAEDSALLLPRFTEPCVAANLPPHGYGLYAFYFVFVAAPIFAAMLFALLVVFSILCCEVGLLLLCGLELPVLRSVDSSMGGEL